jgi:SecD/SecF fusion protein
VTRLIFESMLSRERDVAFGSKATLVALRRFSVNFLAKRRTAYLVSGVILAAGIGSLVVRGLEYGVDFQGGYSFVVRFDEPVNTNEVRTSLTGPLEGTPVVKTFGESNQVKITTDYLINSSAEDANSRVESQLMQGLEGLPYGQAKIMSSQKVGPTIADDIQRSALFSVVFSLLIIFFYIFVRFRKWQYGLGATITLFHDVLIVLSLFSLLYGVLPFSLAIDQAFIAALLTVVGYSINDTVVVFDRIRERLGSRKRSTFMDTVNNALNETLSRTLITSLTTLLVVLVLFIFGGEIIRGFSFALLIGVAVGTYSSVFIATPIVVDFEKEKEPANA